MGRFTFLGNPDTLNHYLQDPHMTFAAGGTLTLYRIEMSFNPIGNKADPDQIALVRAA